MERVGRAGESDDGGDGGEDSDDDDGDDDICVLMLLLRSLASVPLMELIVARTSMAVNVALSMASSTRRPASERGPSLGGRVGKISRVSGSSALSLRSPSVKRLELELLCIPLPVPDSSSQLSRRMRRMEDGLRERRERLGSVGVVADAMCGRPRSR